MSRFLDLPGPAAWTGLAACTTAVADLFFPGPGQSTSRAEAICRSCVVRILCLETALKRPAEGVWGGFSERNRAEVRRLYNLGGVLEEIVAAADARHYARVARAIRKRQEEGQAA